MPPYRYDRDVGIQELKYDLRLSEAEIQTIARWVDSGAPSGNPADLPPRRSVPGSRRVGVRGPVRPAGSDRQDETVHAAGQRPGRVVAAGRADRPHARIAASRRSRQAVAEGPRRGASRQQRAGRVRREDRRVRRDASGLRSTRSARPARSFRPTRAARCRPTRWCAGTCTTTRPARRS